MILALAWLIGPSLLISEVLTPKQVTAYRSITVSIVPSFASPEVITYRFVGTEWTDRKDKVITMDRYSGRGGYDWGEICAENIRVLTKEEAKRLIALLEKIKFDELVTGYDVVGNDGTKWTIAIKKNGMEVEYSFSITESIDENTGKDLKYFVSHMRALASKSKEKLEPGGTGQSH